jgi:hypothetical protein
MFFKPNLAKLEKKKDVKGLCAVLSQAKDTEVRKKAAEALGRTGDKSSETPLINVLRDEPDSEVRMAALNSLEKIKSKDASPYVMQTAIDDEAIAVRQTAVDVLKIMGDFESLSKLVGLLRDENRLTRIMVAEALHEITDDRFEPMLITELKENDEAEVRMLAARSLGRIGNLESEAALCSALHDCSERVRGCAAGCLLEASYPVSFKCRKCSHIYSLRCNATVETAQGLARGAGLAAVNVSHREDTHTYPDNIIPIKRNWNTLPPDIIIEQEVELKRIARDLSSGKIRFYKCSECKEIQGYQETLYCKVDKK